MRSYEAARGMYSFLAFCSWVIICGGAFAGFATGIVVGESLGGRASALQIAAAIAPGAVVAAIGCYGLALVQMGRCSVDTAEYAQQALQVARDQLEVSRDVLAQGKAAALSYAGLLAAQPKVAQPVSGSENTQTATYADQSAASNGAVSAQADATPAQLAAGSAALPSPTEQPLPEVIPKDGLFLVGNKAFGSESDALDYLNKQANA